MLLILAGKSGTGKSTIQQKLIEMYGYQKVVTYTTRPIRPNEVNGIDYNFVPLEVFRRLKEDNFFIETTKYKVAVDDNLWHYGTSYESLYPNGNDKVIIMNPDGVDVIKRELPRESYCICYLVASDKIIQDRLTKRGDNEDEIVRRMLADKEDFADFKFDIMIPNEGIETLDEITEDVNKCVGIFMAGKGKEDE